MTVQEAQAALEAAVREWNVARDVNGLLTENASDIDDVALDAGLHRFRQAEFHLELSLAALDAARKAEAERRANGCEACGGMGWRILSSQAAALCPACNGTGRKEE